ncbi:hypothetical protein VT84_07790 [Gemmata sp. SH-PL17]|uniref:IS3 family transposase n=1 Tax=Gemmata sp. SH-PL17 TaxID=1630693 RepID=UPI0004AE53FD|nr:IS3 family transposase [Gemmata sp. SH-PL17]AMV24282.1 hypothetical protein VT84_07790 [Gemmata sp. SH-PL17]
MGSLFGRLKYEMASGPMFVPRDQARAGIFKCPEAFYNRVRRQSALRFLSPEEFDVQGRVSDRTARR